MREGAASLHCRIHTHHTAEKPKHPSVGRNRCKCPLRTVISSENPLLQPFSQKQYELPGTAKETKHINEGSGCSRPTAWPVQKPVPLQREEQASVQCIEQAIPLSGVQLLSCCWAVHCGPCSAILLLTKLLLRQQRLLVYAPRPGICSTHGPLPLADTWGHTEKLFPPTR